MILNIHIFIDMIHVLFCHEDFFKCLKLDFHLRKKFRAICLIESPLKVTRNAFYFILQVLLVLNIFKFLLRLFDHMGKTA